MPFPLALAASLLPAAYQGIKGLVQKGQAKNLKKSEYIPKELLMNKDLATQQAYSRRSPGQANAESLALRSQANQISAGQRSFGGDANKLAAVTSAATAQTNDSLARIAGQGQQFSEGAFGRLGFANSAIAGQERENMNQFVQRRDYLNQSGDQNIFNSVSNIGSAVVGGLASGELGGGGEANNMIKSGKAMNKALGAKANLAAFRQDYDPTINTGGRLPTINKNPGIGSPISGNSLINAGRSLRRTQMMSSNPWGSYGMQYGGYGGQYGGYGGYGRRNSYPGQTYPKIDPMTGEYQGY